MRALTAAEITALLACPVMRVRQAEAVFKINRNRLYAMMADGSLPFVMIGSSRLIRTETLQNMTTPQSGKAA
jgi:excisionase family DNA binding protein